jgi:hypothetical protein
MCQQTTDTTCRNIYRTTNRKRSLSIKGVGLDRLGTGVVALNPAQGVDVCCRVFVQVHNLLSEILKVEKLRKP